MPYLKSPWLSKLRTFRDRYSFRKYRPGLAAPGSWGKTSRAHSQSAPRGNEGPMVAPPVLPCFLLQWRWQAQQWQASGAWLVGVCHNSIELWSERNKGSLDGLVRLDLYKASNPTFLLLDTKRERTWKAKQGRMADIKTDFNLSPIPLKPSEPDRFNNY